MRRGESISPRSSASVKLRQSASVKSCTSHETQEEECFGQGRCGLSRHLNTVRQKVLCFLRALPSVAQGLPAEPEDVCVFLPISLLHSLARCVQQIHTLGSQAQNYCIAEWAWLTRCPQNKSKSGKERHTVS